MKLDQVRTDLEGTLSRLNELWARPLSGHEVQTILMAVRERLEETIRMLAPE